MIDWFSANGEWIVPLSTMMVAVIALSVSIWQGWTTRTHNRKSVIPRLNIEARTLIDEDSGYGVHNVGLGPAEIEDMQIFVDGKQIPGTGEERATQMLKALGLHVRGMSIMWLGRGTLLPAGKMFWFIRLPKDLVSDATIDMMGPAFKRIRVVIKYSSIYGDIFPDADSDLPTF